MVKSEPKKKPQSGGFFQRFFRKSEKSQKEQRLTVQRSIPYLEMGRDGICRVEEHLYSKTVRFYDINYQLAQNEDKNTIFESWCDFLNYFDASIRFQLSFINHKSDMSEYNKVIQIEPQHDQFDDVRMEYAQMLKQQLAKGNNGLVRTKYITFSIEAKSVREAKPRLERIETDILNNFKVLGVKAYGQRKSRALLHRRKSTPKIPCCRPWKQQATRNLKRTLRRKVWEPLQRALRFWKSWYPPAMCSVKASR